MSTRKRVRSSSQTIIGSGGGSGGGGGTVAWGPRFGKNEDDTFETQGGVALGDLAVEGELTPTAAALLAALEVTGLGTLSAAQAASMDLALSGETEVQAAALLSALEATYGLAQQAAVDLNELALVGQAASQQAVDLVEMALEGALTPQGAALLAALEADYGDTLAALAGVDLWSVDLDGGVGATTTLDLTDLSLAGTLSPSGALATTVNVQQMLPQEDTWLDQANTGTAHGADATLGHKTSDPLQSNDRRGYIAWDLTTFSGVTASGDGTLDVWTRFVDSVAGTTASPDWELYRSAAKPFEEDTATWAGDEPPPGTLLASGSFTAMAATFVQRTVTVAQADLDAALGEWLYLRLLGASGLGGGNDFETRSKESATTAERPRLNFTAEVS